MDGGYHQSVYVVSCQHYFLESAGEPRRCNRLSILQKLDLSVAYLRKADVDRPEDLPVWEEQWTGRELSQWNLNQERFLNH